MENAPVVIVEKTIGDTLYIIENEISNNARETAYDKVKKLILNDTENSEKVKAS